MSIVKMVEEELKMEVREDMSAAIMTASIMPRAPAVEGGGGRAGTCGHEVQHQPDVGDVGAAGGGAADPHALGGGGAGHLGVWGFWYYS